MIVIDGNIGSGKSTVLDRLAGLGYTVHKEKIDKWPLEEFYQDRETWSMPLQLAVFNSMKPLPGIHERCPDSAYHVFWRGSHVGSPESHVGSPESHVGSPESHVGSPESHVGSPESHVGSPEDQVVTDFYQRHRWTPEVHVYLRASPEWCLNNISKRSQTGDSGITLEYLQSLHHRYDEFFMRVPNVTIDAERSIDDILSDTIRCLL